MGASMAPHRKADMPTRAHAPAGYCNKPAMPAPMPEPMARDGANMPPATPEQYVMAVARNLEAENRNGEPEAYC